MNDRLKFRVWFAPDWQDPEMIYEAEHTYDNRCRNKGSFHHESFGELLEDKDCIVMQSTGLKDKNGKLIYEADIVRYAEYANIDDVESDWEYGEIVWGDKYSYPAFDFKNGNLFDCNGLSYIFNEGWVIEVIGNIYENKELLSENSRKRGGV